MIRSANCEKVTRHCLDVLIRRKKSLHYLPRIEENDKPAYGSMQNSREINDFWMKVI